MESNNKRIAKNTLMLYFRQLLILFVSLYTVRIVLEVLGVEDYGIYNVVGGLVSFFSFLSATMASATQRFFSFALGQRNIKRLKETFTVNWIIYLIIAVFALLLLETAGLWFVKEQLHIPAERYEAACFVYQFSVLTFLVTILTTPFMAIIIAHEDMQIYAYVSIIEAILKLAIVFMLLYLPWEKLELYGILIFAVSAINAFIYISICVLRYEECRFRLSNFNRRLMSEVIGFTGWTLFGQVTTVTRNQAITILLNQMFNPVIVAARAIAINVANQINIFSNNFNVGLYPPIIKAYASDDRNNMFSLIFNGSKITFFLMWVFALPLFLEMDTVLSLWLKNPPQEAVFFTRLSLIEVLISSVGMPVVTAARAPGKMKVYELVLGSIQLGIFAISWLVLAMGGAAYTVFIVAIVISLVMFVVRLLLVRPLIGLSVKLFFLQVITPVSLVILLSSSSSYIIHLLLPKGLVFAGISILTSMLLAIVSMYFVGLDKVWRDKLHSMVVNKIRNIL